MLKGKLARLMLHSVWVITLFVAVSCNKEPDEIGLDLQPDSEKPFTNYTDTTSLVTYSNLQDSVRTSYTSHSVLGRYEDPVFGLVSASIFTRLELSSSGVSFGDNPQLDSITLQLIYDGYYGRDLSEQRIKVFELDEDISSSIDSFYYSNQTVAIKQDKKYLDAVFKPGPNDSIWVDSTTAIAPRLSINLSDELGNKFLNASEAQLEDNASFYDFFKGIYITTEKVGGGQGALLYLDLPNAESHIRLFYHNDENDSLSYDFDITSLTPRFMHFEHKYSHAAAHFRNQLLNNDTTLGQEMFYVQGLSGPSARIHFPHIESWRKIENIAINEAKLVFSPRYDGGELAPPDQLALVALNKEGEQYVLDDQLEGGTYYGGAYDKSSNQYYFRITRYVQSLISGVDTLNSDGLRMVVSGGAIYGNRAILNGPESEEKPMKLEITYSKMN